MKTKFERPRKAYQFLCKKERNSESFSLIDLANYAGWALKTPKTYIGKQWSSFIRRDESDSKKYFCNGLADKVTEEKFLRLHSQKEKYSIKISNDQEMLINKAKEFRVLAIYNYNSPYTEFKTYSFIIHMIIAWTSLLQAIMKKQKVDYYHKDKPKKDGEYLTWVCLEYVKKYWKNSSPAAANLKLLYRLRNVIEHHLLPFLDIKVAGLCQVCLNNFEVIIAKEFGNEHTLHFNTTLALQIN
jgi:hypothetical protein